MAELPNPDRRLAEEVQELSARHDAGEADFDRLEPSLDLLLSLLRVGVLLASIPAAILLLVKPDLSVSLNAATRLTGILRLRRSP